jgi:hypothetical protein
MRCECGHRDTVAGWWAHLRVEVIEPALASHPTPSTAVAEGLDVERLRRAIAACVDQNRRQWRQTFDIIWTNGDDVLPSEAAELIAAEYARLTTPNPTGGHR